MDEMDSYVLLLGDLGNLLSCCLLIQSSIGFLGGENKGLIGRRGGGKEKDTGVCIGEKVAGGVELPMRTAGSFSFSRSALPRNIHLGTPLEASVKQMSSHSKHKVKKEGLISWKGRNSFSKTFSFSSGTKV